MFRGARRRLLVVLFVLFALAMWASGTYVHGLVVEMLKPPWDKLVHICLFTVVGLLVGAVLGVRRPRDLWRIYFVTLMLGAVDEGLQYFDPSRSLDMDDLLANAVGALLGTALLALHWRWREWIRVRKGGVPHDEDPSITRR